MELSSYFRICVYFCIIMIVFTLCVNFISLMGIFSTVPVDTSDIMESTGIDITWGALLTLAGAGAIATAWMLGSISVIGIYLFSAVFWTSYNSAINITKIGNFIPTELLAIFTVALLFIWVAAVISMTTTVS